MSADDQSAPNNRQGEDASNPKDAHARRASDSRAGGDDRAPQLRDGEDSTGDPGSHVEVTGEDGLEAVDAELLIEEAAERVVERLVAQSISGPVPSPDLLHGYTPEEQERIFRIAEAFTSDESKRRDRIVESSVRIAQKAQWVSPVLLVFAFGTALGSYALYENVILSALFLSVPVLRVVGASVTSAIRKRRSDDDDHA